MGSNINIHIQACVSELIIGNTYSYVFAIYIMHNMHYYTIFSLIDVHVLISAPSSFDVKKGIFYQSQKKRRPSGIN